MSKKRGEKEINEVVKEVAQEHGLPEPVVRAIFHSQFECAKEKIEEAKGDPYKAPNIKFLKLGRLIAKKQMIPAIESAKQKTKEAWKEKKSIQGQNRDTDTQ